MSEKHKKPSYALIASAGKGAAASREPMERAGERKERKQGKSRKDPRPAGGAGGAADGVGDVPKEREQEQRARGSGEDGDGEEEEMDGQEEEQAEEEVDGEDDRPSIPGLESLLQTVVEQQRQQQQQLREQQQQQRQLMETVQQWVVGRSGWGSGAGSASVPGPITSAVAGRGGSSAAGAVKRSLFSPAGAARQAAVGGTTAPKQLEIEKLTSFQGEMDSDKLDAWLRKLMVHCSYYGGKGRPLEEEQEKVNYAAAHLEGAAADWWFAVVKGTVATIEEFVKAVNDRFRSVVEAWLITCWRR